MVPGSLQEFTKALRDLKRMKYMWERLRNVLQARSLLPTSSKVKPAIWRAERFLLVPERFLPVVSDRKVLKYHEFV